jgi:uncharacterized membrane protein YhaH (DUF805 family)
MVENSGGPNKYVISLILITIITIVGTLIGNFFDIKYYLYMPYIVWFIALCLFNMVLDTNKTNIFYPSFKE